MIRVNYGTNSTLLTEALKGAYGSYFLPNGIQVLRQGRLIHFQGMFDGTQDVIEIPTIACRIPITFTGEGFSTCKIVEPNAGFCNVPDEAKGRSYVVLATGILNS